jgi:carbon storage regulator
MMLVLSRKAQQKIFIGNPPNQIEVMVCSIYGGKVRLGIVAPKDVPIHRQEVFDKVAVANREAPTA